MTLRMTSILATLLVAIAASANNAASGIPSAPPSSLQIYFIDVEG